MMPPIPENLRFDMKIISKNFKATERINEKWKVRDEEKIRENVRKSNRKIKRWLQKLDTKKTIYYHNICYEFS